MALTKKTVKNKSWKNYIPKVILISYLVLSGLFILLSVFNYIKFSVYGVGFQEGARNTVNQVLQQAQKCEAFQVGEVALVNVACLQSEEQK